MVYFPCIQSGLIFRHRSYAIFRLCANSYPRMETPALEKEKKALRLYSHPVLSSGLKQGCQVSKPLAASVSGQRAYEDGKQWKTAVATPEPHRVCPVESSPLNEWRLHVISVLFFNYLKVRYCWLFVVWCFFKHSGITIRLRGTPQRAAAPLSYVVRQGKLCAG